MIPLNDDEKSAFEHCFALHKQLYSIYPKEHEHLQHQIEALLQLGRNDAAELLLDQLQSLLLSSGLNEDAHKAEHIRKYLSNIQHENHYYSTPFLHLASNNLIKKVFQNHKRIHIKEGEHLIRYGETDNQMYIVLSGELAVWSRDNEGNKYFEHTLKTSEVIGELAFLDGTPRNADVLACCDTCLLVIPEKAVLKLFMDDPKIESTLRKEANIRKIQVEMKKSNVLKKLPHHLQRILAKEGCLMHNKPLERIYQSGERICYIDLVCEGYLHFIGEQSDGSSIMLNVLKAGSLIGCSAITPHMDKHYSADVVCMSQVTCIRFPLASLMNISDLNPRSYQNIIRQAESERDALLFSMQHKQTL